MPDENVRQAGKFQVLSSRLRNPCPCAPAQNVVIDAMGHDEQTVAGDRIELGMA